MSTDERYRHHHRTVPSPGAGGGADDGGGADLLRHVRAYAAISDGIAEEMRTSNAEAVQELSALNNGPGQ